MQSSEGKIAKWGNSLALRVPKDLADKAKIKPGDRVEISLAKNGLRIRLKPEKPKYELKDLLSKVSSENIHPETDFGKIEGKEIW